MPDGRDEGEPDAIWRETEPVLDACATQAVLLLAEVCRHGPRLADFNVCHRSPLCPP